MATKTDLQEWVVNALKANGGKGNIVYVARHIWSNHEQELMRSGDLFFTWQYDMRWAAQALRNAGICKPVNMTRNGRWELA